MKKIDKKFILGFIFGGILLGVSGVCAATILSSKDVTYDNTSSKLNSTNMQDAIDELYNMASTHCPDGYTCVEPPVSFANDSWKTIAANVKIGNTSAYKVGDTKTVDMGDLGTHTVRIANTSKALIENHRIPGSEYFHDIVMNNVSKGSGIAEVLDYLNISKDEAMSIGDSDNDIAMSLVVGTSIAMGNATENLKKCSTQVIKSNACDGLYLFLKTLVDND